MIDSTDISNILNTFLLIIVVNSMQWIQPAESRKYYDFFVHPTLSVRHFDLPLFLTLHYHKATFSSWS